MLFLHVGLDHMAFILSQLVLTWFYVSIFDPIFLILDQCVYSMGCWLFEFHQWIQFAVRLYACLSFFLFLPFHARCRTLLFLDDLTLMQCCINFALCCKQIFSTLCESNSVSIRRQFPCEFLYTSISQSSALDISAKLLLVIISLIYSLLFSF